MLGHKWEPAQGTVVEARSGPTTGHGIGATLHPEQHYVVEVRKPTGGLIRGTVTEKSDFMHAVGATIGVEVHSRTNEIRIDPHARAGSVRAMIDMAQQVRGSQGTAGAGGMAGLAGALGAAASGGASPHVLGPEGQELPIHTASGEISSLAQAMRSGDPAARQAAIDRLRELRDHARDRASRQQAGGGPTAARDGFSGSSGPSSFDDIAAPRHRAAPGETFGEPAGFSSFSEPPAAFSPASQPAAPSPYPPTPPSFTSFDTSGGQGTVEDRLARLRQLLDKGILTESEYQSQRQQIISGL